MKKLFFIFLFAVGVSANAQNYFEGIVHQKDNNADWKFTMNRIDNSSFKVVYPALKCTAIWNLKKTEGDYKIYQEKITIGLDKCNDGEYIYVTDDIMGSSTQYFYIYKKIGDSAEIADGTIDIVEE